MKCCTHRPRPETQYLLDIQLYRLSNHLVVRSLQILEIKRILDGTQLRLSYFVSTKSLLVVVLARILPGVTARLEDDYRQSYRSRISRIALLQQRQITSYRKQRASELRKSMENLEKVLLIEMKKNHVKRDEENFSDAQFRRRLFESMNPKGKSHWHPLRQRHVDSRSAPLPLT